MNCTGRNRSCSRGRYMLDIKTRGRYAMAVQSVNPATEEVLATFEEHSQRQIDEVLDQSVKSFRDWRDRPFAERSRLMHAAATELRRDAERFALLITLEMGKPMAQPRPRSRSAPGAATTSPSNAERFLADDARRRAPPARATSPSTRSAWCWRSCPGTSPSGRCSASPRRR